MHRLLALVVTVTAALAAAAPAGAQCVPTVSWQGRPYVATAETRGTQGGALVERAIRPGCGDMIVIGRPRIAPDTPSVARSVPGVPPQVAIAVDGLVYVNRSSFRAQPSRALQARIASLSGPTAPFAGPCPGSWLTAC